MKVKYVGKIYNVFIVSIIATMLVSIIITVMSSISYSTDGTSELMSINANSDESHYYQGSTDGGAISAPNYASVSNLDNRNAALVGANYVSSNIAKFSLVDYIPLNTQIKNQGATNTCWTFSTLSSIQTSLALNDYLNDKPAYEYDYSERHVSLASIETTSNKNGYVREPIDGATYWMAMNYYTRSMGPVLEEECPFSEDNNTVPNNSNTYDKNQAATVTDIKMFPDPSAAGYDAETNINNMKTYIRTKGALCATMYFPTTSSDTTFNFSKGASYVNSSSLYQINHMISIVGWDDNYSKDNFNSNNKPSKNGAWLVRNSHGDIPITDNGFLHISYEDQLIYSTVFGLEKTDLAKNYSQVVGYNEKGNNNLIGVPATSYSLYTVFDRNKNNNINELIDSVSLYLLDDCSVSIAIAEGDYSTNRNIEFRTQTLTNSNTVSPGFRTFNLKTPYRFNTTSSNASGLSNAVTVRVSVNTAGNPSMSKIAMEGGFSKPYISEMNNQTYTNLQGMVGTTKTETNRCFMSYGSYASMDLGKLHSSNASLVDGDSTIQINLVEGSKPTGALAVKTNPTKTQYNPGENFNSAGLSLKYNAGHGSTLNIKLADCTLKKDKSLTNGQTAVEVYGYGTKVNVPITVGSAPVEMTPTLTIKTNPTKTSYNVGDNFDPTGLVLKYTHGNANNPTVDEISGSAITITDGTSLKENQTYVTAKYNNLTVRVPITVTKKTENPTPTFNDTDNLKNMKNSLDEVKFNSKSASGFDSMKVTLSDIKENSGATYKYYYYVSNKKNETSSRVEANATLSNGKLVLNIDTSKVGSAFRLKDEDDEIYLTIIQANITAGTEVSVTSQVLGSNDTKYYLDGQLKVTGNASTNDPNTPGAQNPTNEVQNNTTNLVISNTNTTNGGNQTTPTNTSGDPTIATKKIPQTGTTEEIFKIVIISIILVAGAFIVKSYIINKNINGK